MKTIKLNSLWIGFVFFLVGTFCSFSQETNNANGLKSNASVVLSVKKNGLSDYSFTPLTDYNEANVRQHVGRIEQITGGTVKYEYKEGAVHFMVNSDKIKGDDLDNLIRGFVVLHGYSGYQIN